MMTNREDPLRPQDLPLALAEWRVTYDALSKELEVGGVDQESFHAELDDFWEATLQIVETGLIGGRSAAEHAEKARTLLYHPNFPGRWYA